VECSRWRSYLPQTIIVSADRPMESAFLGVHRPLYLRQGHSLIEEMRSGLLRRAETPVIIWPSGHNESIRTRAKGAQSEIAHENPVAPIMTFAPHMLSVTLSNESSQHKTYSRVQRPYRVANIAMANTALDTIQNVITRIFHHASRGSSWLFLGNDAPFPGMLLWVAIIGRTTKPAIATREDHSSARFPARVPASSKSGPVEEEVR
jgi:hypothetical protein